MGVSIGTSHLSKLAGAMILSVAGVLVPGADCMAQSTSRPLGVVSASVFPATAAPGEARAIVIRAENQSCDGAIVATIDPMAPSGKVRILLAPELLVPLPFSGLDPCRYGGQVERVVAWVPAQAGTTAVEIVHEASVVAQTSIVTEARIPVKSKFDVTGMWYDPATVGSGVSLLHGFGGSDRVLGTWFAVQPSSAWTSWISVQGGRWTGDGSVFEAFTIGADALAEGYPEDSAVYGFGYSGTRPARYVRIKIVGMLRIMFSSPTRATAVVTGFDGANVFTSRLERLEF